MPSVEVFGRQFMARESTLRKQPPLAEIGTVIECFLPKESACAAYTGRVDGAIKSMEATSRLPLQGPYPIERLEVVIWLKWSEFQPG